MQAVEGAETGGRKTWEARLTPVGHACAGARWRRLALHLSLFRSSPQPHFSRSLLFNTFPPPPPLRLPPGQRSSAVAFPETDLGKPFDEITPVRIFSDFAQHGNAWATHRCRFIRSEYKQGDVVWLAEGTEHTSHTETGCLIAVYAEAGEEAPGDRA